MPFYKEGGGVSGLTSLNDFSVFNQSWHLDDDVNITSPLAGEVEFVNTNSGEGLNASFNEFSKPENYSNVEKILEPCHPEERSDVGIASSSNIDLTPHPSYGHPLPQGARGKAAFTMAEILIALAIIGIACMILIPVIRKAMPDYITVMKRKCYQILEDKVTQMYYDDDLYVRGTKRGFGNLQNIEHNGKTYGGNTKFCELFASMMNKWGGATCEEDKMTFKTADNVYWYLPVTDFSKGYAVVKFDVNGSKKPNCEYDATTCPKPDTFRYYVLGNGKISEHEPKPEEFDYCIKTIITGSGSVLPSAEYCGLKNGTYELTSVPATGWSSPWAGNKKEVTILDSDEVVYLNFTKEATPEPTTPTEPTVPTTPTEPTTPNEPAANEIDVHVEFHNCPYFQNLGTSDNAKIKSSYSKVVNSLNEFGQWCCYSKIELYANGKLMTAIKPEKPYYNPSYILGELATGIYVSGNHSYGNVDFLINANTSGFYNSNIKENKVTIKMYPRSMFNADVTEKTCDVNFDTNNISACSLITHFSAKKQADSNGWLNIDGTLYKVTNYPDNKKTNYGSINYATTDDQSLRREGLELACSTIGGQPANVNQVEKFINSIAPVEFSLGKGCTAFHYDDWSMFGLTNIPTRGGRFGCFYFNHLPEGSMPEYNTNTSSNVHNVLCVK